MLFHVAFYLCKYRSASCVLAVSEGGQNLTRPECHVAMLFLYRETERGRYDLDFVYVMTVA